MEKINNLLSEFDPIHLDKMNEAALLDRVETKFITDKGRLKSVLAELVPHYKVLEIENRRINKYNSQYFDTDSFFFFSEHHRGRLKRLKIRYREYKESGLIFFEIKQKGQKGKTTKHRIQVDEIKEELGSKELDFLNKTIKSKFDLNFSLKNAYSRVTLVNKLKPERVTIDFNLAFHINGDVRKFENFVILEVKQMGNDRHSPIIKVLKKYRIFRTSFSKYCIGISLKFPELKSNNFKSKIQRLNKIELADGIF